MRTYSLGVNLRVDATTILILFGVAALVAFATSRFVTRWARRTLAQNREHVDRFKLTRKQYVVERVLELPAVAEAVRQHSALTFETEAQAWKKVNVYLNEIVPFFNILAYYRLGYWVSRALLGLFYKVSVEYERPDPFRGLPRDSIVIYLMNHRSNADYVLVAYVMMGDVSISYAVGEWARAFPLEYIFKTFGSYFIRRRYREPLYHAVLESYVQLITRNSVTQGVFPEGGLTRDGALRPGKIGLLDYALGVAREPDARSRMYVVPVGINYDRVLEDRTLLRELEMRAERPVASRGTQFREVASYLFSNVRRLITGRWKRYGRAAVAIGTPISVDAWLADLERQHVNLFELSRAERLPLVQQFCDSVLVRIGNIIPVTSVPLACAAIQSFDADFIPRDKLLARMEAMRDVLLELNGRVVRADRDIGETFERAYRMLRLRRIVSRAGDGFVVLPRGRALITYYANSIVHLLGPFAAGVRARDALPMDQLTRSDV